jgi:hypothetical protein
MEKIKPSSMGAVTISSSKYTTKIFLMPYKRVRRGENTISMYDVIYAFFAIVNNVTYG